MAAIPAVGTPMIPGKQKSMDQVRIDEINKEPDPEKRKSVDGAGIIFNLKP